MIIYVGKDYQDVSRKAANIMSAQIIMKPNASSWIGNRLYTGRII